MMKLKFIYATLALLLLFSCSVEDNIHYNWGWGSSKFYNGYYLSKVFDTNSGPEIYDNEVTRSGQSCYYKYNLEYSIISR